jgi:hypothetical protein
LWEILPTKPFVNFKETMNQINQIVVKAYKQRVAFKEQAFWGSEKFEHYMETSLMHALELNNPHHLIF